MAKQVMDIRAGKGMTLAESNEHLRVPLQKGKVHAMSRGNNYDITRDHLNFEIKKGGVITPLDRDWSIARRIKENLSSRGIKDPNEGLQEPKFRTVAKFIFGGSRERMRELAFGNQVVEFDDKNVDNSHIRREKDIEEWAKDIYKFVSDKFGEENIAAFVVHLDELNPHIHCTLLPIKDGKFKYKEIFAGKDKFEFSAKSKALHNELAKVNARWGLDRGSPIAETHARHRTTEEYRRELTEEYNSMERGIAQKKDELEQLQADIRKALKAKKSLETMIANLQKKMEQNNALIQKFNEQMRAKVGDPEKLKAECERLKAENAKLEEQLADKQDKCQKAEQRLQELTKEMGKVKEWTDNVEKKGMEYAERVLKVYDVDIRDAILASLSNELQGITKAFEQNGNDLFDDTLAEGLAQNGNRLIQCTIDLFVGAVCDATTFAKGHGGGGTSNNNWGRKKDEDDFSWARRCARMAAMYLKSSGGRGRKLK